MSDPTELGPGTYTIPAGATLTVKKTKPPTDPPPTEPPPTPPNARVIEIRGEHGPVSVQSERRPLVIRFLEGASIRGSGQDGILLVDCPTVTIEGNGAPIRGFQNAVRVADTGKQDWNRIWIENLDLSNNHIHGVLAVNAWGVSVVNCRGTGIDGSEKAHLVYFSVYGRSTGKGRVQGCYSRDVRGADILVNAETGDDLAGPIEILDCDLGNDSEDFVLGVLGGDVTVRGGRLWGRVNADRMAGHPSHVVYDDVDRRGEDNELGGSVIETV